MNLSAEHLDIDYLFDGYLDDSQGVPNYIKTLGDYMESRGHDAQYVVGGSEEVAPNISIIGRTATLGVNGNRVEVALPIFKRAAREVLETTDPDVIHLQIPHNPLVSGRIVNQARRDVPVVGSFHVLPNSRTMEVGLRALGQYEQHFGRIDHIISNSPASQKFVKKMYGLDSTLIPCPIDVSELSKGRKLEEYNDGQINIVFLGRLVERKGVQHLVDAVAGLDRQTRDKVRLVIAGEGPLGDQLQQQVNDAGLSPYTKFWGYVEDHEKADLFATADLAVFPATGGESFGMVLAEAMAAKAGVVIGGNNDGYSSILSDTPELLFDPHDTRKFTGLLRDLILNQTTRQEFHALQQKTVERFDIKTVGAQVEKIYRQLLR